MRTIQIETYTFDELSDEAKDTVIEDMYYINVEDHEWWSYTYEDAGQIGLEITEFDIDRGSYCKGKLTMSLTDSIQAIINNHGDTTETYTLALEYKEKLQEAGRQYKNRGINEDAMYNYEEAIERIEEAYERDLCGAYLGILRKEYEYYTSKEVIIETIIANDYVFTKEGKGNVYI